MKIPCDLVLYMGARSPEISVGIAMCIHTMSRWVASYCSAARPRWRLYSGLVHASEFSNIFCERAVS